MQLVQRHPGPPTLGQRPGVVVPGENLIEVRRATEERQLGQVGLAVPAMCGRIDEVDPLLGAEQVARLQVAVQPGRLVAQVAVRVDPVHQLLDQRDVASSERAPVGGHPQVRQQPALREPLRPVGPGSVVLR